MRACARRATHAPANVSLFEGVVSGKRLVGPFTREHHLVARGADVIGKQHHGHGRRPDDRGLGVPHHPCKGLRNGVPIDADGRVITLQVMHQGALMHAFVEGRVGKAKREAAQPRLGMPVHDGRDDGRVQTPRQVGPNRHVSTQLQLHGVDHQAAQLLGGVIFGHRVVFGGGVKGPSPVAFGLRAMTVYRHHMRWRHAMHTFKNG